MRRLMIPLIAVLAVTSVAGCSLHRKQNELEVGAGQEARVAVRNNNWLDMVIYAERGSMRMRLGTVTSMGNETMTIPRNMLASVSSIRLIAAPIGSPADYSTFAIDIWPGDTVEFTIENSLGLSTVTSW